MKELHCQTLQLRVPVAMPEPPLLLSNNLLSYRWVMEQYILNSEWESCVLRLQWN